MKRKVQPETHMGTHIPDMKQKKNFKTNNNDVVSTNKHLYPIC